MGSREDAKVEEGAAGASGAEASAADLLADDLERVTVTTATATATTTNVDAADGTTADGTTDDEKKQQPPAPEVVVLDTHRACAEALGRLIDRREPVAVDFEVGGGCTAVEVS